MKKILIPACTIVILSSCGGSKAGESENSDSIKATVTETLVSNANSNIIDPLAYDFTKPISPIVLTESMNAYYAQEVQLIVYPENYVDKEKFVQDQPAKALADAKDRGITISFTTVPAIEYTKGTAYIVKGKLSDFRSSTWTPDGSFTLTNATLVGEAKETKPAKFNIGAINSTDVYSAQDFLTSALAWSGKKILLIADYNGLTTSKATDGKILEIRADMADASGNFIIGCAFDQEPGAALQAGAKNVKINGTIDSEFHYGRPYLKGCQVMQ